MTIEERLRRDLTDAVRAKEADRVGVLRVVLGAIANAGAVRLDERHEPAGLLGDVAPRQLTEDDVRAIVLAEQAELRGNAASWAAMGRAAEAEGFTAMAAMLDAYLSEP